MLFIGCTGSGESGNAELGKADSALLMKSLPLPAVPASIKDPRERVRYALNHYWDAMDWRDTSLLNNPDFMEQTMANYFSLISNADSLIGSDGFNRMIASASINPEALKKVVDISGRYLYEPESPMYDPEGYAMLLDQLIIDPMGSGMPGETLEARHADIMKNRQGHKATDFTFIDRDGHHRTLAKTAAETDETILLFYDPNCNVCESIEKLLATSERINSLIKKGSLRIVAVDPFGTEEEAWKSHAASLPTDWIVGRSPGGKVDEDEIYVIRATPAIYLLDSKMTVKLKEATEKDISEWL